MIIFLQAVYWQKYAEMELDEPDPSRAKVVFSRCLLSCPIVKLWSLYLRFIKKVALLMPPDFWAMHSVFLLHNQYLQLQFTWIHIIEMNKDGGNKAFHVQLEAFWSLQSLMVS